MRPRPWAVVAGGGTAGHVIPALAVARALVDAGHDPATIHFVGSARAIERRLVPEAGFGITLLPGRGIARRLTLANIGAALGIVVAVVRALLLVARWRPAVVLSVGGYAALPAAAAAIVLRIPLVLAEQNAYPGAVHRLLGRFARAAAVAFPGTPLPRAVVTGNPVRREILAADRSPGGRAAARAHLGVPDGRRLVAVFGGSLGARRINMATLGVARAWAGRGDVAFRHAIGERDWSELSLRLPSPPDGGLWYSAVRYEDAMPLVLTAADVAVCRAGGTTVAEHAVLGLPSILVPLPIAADDHQTANARSLVDAGAAVLVPDGELTDDRLARELDALLADDARRAAMETAMRNAARADAAERVARLVEEHARRG